ncbi:acyl carrier protein [Kitasatospora cineracea]|uniref:acyl carrier protein n=1 Tax=Kitasatospora cineracea TaxID=88074 RepID=UPI00378CF24E
MRTYLADLLSSTYQIPVPVDPTATFEELGLDSLSLAELGAHLQDRLGLELAEGEVSASTSVDSLADLLAGKGVEVPR